MCVHQVSLLGVSRDSGVMEGAVRKISVAFNLQRLMYVYFPRVYSVVYLIAELAVTEANV